MRLLGPFAQIATFADAASRGALPDAALGLACDAGVVVRDGVVSAVGPWQALSVAHPEAERWTPVQPSVLVPGLVDAHTHLCFGGDRARDYALRVAGSSYLEIAAQGGGIWSTVLATRQTSASDLARLTRSRLESALDRGVTTAEVKSGYGLSIDGELRMLESIAAAAAGFDGDVVPTCLAAHILPRDFVGGATEWIDHIVSDLLPEVGRRELARRVDIYVDRGAFGVDDAVRYLDAARSLGFDVTVHADQFSTGGVEAAVRCGARSADHLEVSDDASIAALAASDVVAVALPGASMGLGEPWAPARRLLDAGATVAIASDWNPGSAPMGHLLLQACVLGAAQKLTIGETLAGVTFRAAAALGLADRGRVVIGQRADLVAFPVDDVRNIFWHQGMLAPSAVWCRGRRVR